MKINKCINKVVAEDREKLEEIFRAIDFKKRRTEYHAKTARERYDTIFQKSIVHIKNHIDDLNNVAFEVEAMIDTLNTLPDICAQLVNLVILSSLLSKKSVSIYKVRDNIPNNLSDLKNTIIKWIESKEFRYIRGFCNISKHRSLIDRDYFTHINYRNKSTKRGIRFYAFKYDGVSYPEKMMNELFAIKDDFMHMFCDVIEEMEKLI